MSGLGNHHHAIATADPDAQKFFDQGFSLVFAFNHEEAVRAFQRASELDPKAPMPLWGIAWAVGPNYNLDLDDPRARQAFDAISKAKVLSANGPAHEREYIEAMAVRYSDDLKADRTQLGRRYSRAMAELRRRHPDDLDAATLYAESLMNLRPWKLWTLDGKPAEDTLEIVAILESILQRDPNHLGANHYYIHTVEASQNPARALPSARRLETLAPSAGHLVHMPAHIYARTGDQAAAARANQAGADADRVYLKTAPADSFYGLAYFSHNLHFLADSHMMQGRQADAARVAAELAERLGPHAQMMPMVESMIVTPLSVLLRFSRNDDVLKVAEPPADRPVVAAWRRFARGVALARLGRVAEADAERRALIEALRQVPDSALFGGTGLESAGSILGLATIVLDARLAWARGAQQESIGLWTKAVAAADRVPYDEPPVWFYPVRESLGAALVLAGRASDAERVFRADLERHPRNPRSLFGLRESLVRQGKQADAGWVDRAFEEAWKNADVKLTLESL
jgi:tetratricopeptide (TPR) repeat protein